MQFRKRYLQENETDDIKQKGTWIFIDNNAENPTNDPNARETTINDSIDSNSDNFVDAINSSSDQNFHNPDPQSPEQSSE